MLINLFGDNKTNFLTLEFGKWSVNQVKYIKWTIFAVCNEKHAKLGEEVHQQLKFGEHILIWSEEMQFMRKIIRKGLHLNPLCQIIRKGLHKNRLCHKQS